MELLYFRLSGQFSRISSGAKTIESEIALGLDRSSYYYIGHAQPNFGALIVAHDRDHALSGVFTHASPFDTGGLAQNHVVTKLPLSHAEKRDLVARWSYPDRSFAPPFDAWSNAAFASIEDYVSGETRPLIEMVPEIDVAECSERAWIWEGRLSNTEYPEAPLRVSKIFAKPNTKALYFGWLRESRRLPTDKIAKHLEFVNDVIEEVNLPVVSMRDYVLRKRDNV